MNSCEVDKLKEMASRSLSSMLHFGRTKEDQVNQEMNVQQDIHVVPQEKPQIVPPKKRRSLPKVQYPDAEVIALSPTTLMAKNRFVCEVCSKGFPRDQNLQLHKRGHNLPWKLKHKSLTDEVKRKVYLCPEPSCVNHDPSHALGDLTGIKKHYSRKHGEKKYKCQKCEKMYAVRSDLKAHAKTCGTREYKCHCDTIFSRRDSFINHRAFCDALTEGIPTINSMGVNSIKRTETHNQSNQMNINLSLFGSQSPPIQNVTGNNLEVAPIASSFGQKSYNNVMIQTSKDVNYYNPSTSCGKSSNKKKQHKNEGNPDTRCFTNLVNNTTTAHKSMQPYNLNFMGNPISSRGGEGSSLFSSGSIVSHHSTSVYLSSHTGCMQQLSTTGLLKKTDIFGSMSNTIFSNGYARSSSSGVGGGTNFENGYFRNSYGESRQRNMNELLNSFRNSDVRVPIFNQQIDATNEHGVSYQGGMETSSSDMDFEKHNNMKTTRDFLGVGMEIVGNISSDGP